MSAFKAKSTIFSFLILVAGLAAIGSFFMVWYTWGPLSITGLQLITDYSISGSAYLDWMPLLVLMSGLSVAISGLVALVRQHNGINWSVVLSGLIILVAAALFYTNSSTSDFAGTGVLVAMAAGVLVIVFSVLSMVVKDKKTAS